MDLSTKLLLKTEAEKGIKKTICGVEFTICYYNSTPAQLFFQAEVNRLKAEDATKSKEDILYAAINSTLVEKIVLGWSDLEEGGESVPYSKDTLAGLLDKYDGLNTAIMAEAIQIYNFRESEAKLVEEK